ncbi:MAG: RagB/SusD family nutrient uptake outer membrane protein, partial [Polaribacter sp.]
MKNNSNNIKSLRIPKIWFILIISVLGISCSEDFLDKKPEDSIAPENFFHKASDLRIYVNGMYPRLAPQYTPQSLPRLGGGNSNLALDLGTDVVLKLKSVTSSLFRWSTPSVASTTNGDWKNGYKYIREDNYFLFYANKNAEDNAATQHYIGEAYFFRAWDYFKMLRLFGGVPIIKNLLKDNNTKELYKARSSRYEVAKQIIEDLNSAIDRLSWQGKGEASAAGRINKEAAITLKARVALYEGTWERYHGKKGTAYAVSGKDGTEFLQMIEPTVQELINHQGSNIYTKGGDVSMAYNQLFAQDDVAGVAGVFLYKVYDASKLKRSHNFFQKINDYSIAITNNLVDVYLNKDGSQQTISTPYVSTLNELSADLDPRFKQTIWTPNKGPLNELTGRGGDGVPFRYPILAKQAPYEFFTCTGYRNFKGAVFAQQDLKGDVDDVLMRYAEPLLCYAEAKAILGTITQGDLDITVNLLRSRVGMTPMDLTAGATFSYNEGYGFDLTETPLVNEIRRERMVEFALEGFRLDDLKRWAVYDKVINGYKPRGPLLQEFLDYYNRTPAQVALDKGADETQYSQLRKDGYTIDKFNKLVPGLNVDAFSDGRVNPFFSEIDFEPGGRGFYIDPNRDYLKSIPLEEIGIYKANGAELSQNPG